MAYLKGKITCIFLILTNTIIAMGSEIGFCPQNVTLTFETECTSCHINVFVDCPSSAEKLTKMEGTPGCRYEVHLGPGPNITKDGCTHTCRRTIKEDQCCKGFWGPKCDECPGGYRSSCNGHGTCSDLVNGTGQCTCEPGWTGYACEFCINSSVVKENCTQGDYKTASFDVSCMNITCPNNSKCVVVDDEALCMCNWPYVEHKTNTSDNSSIICKEIDVCTLGQQCHDNAACSRSDVADVTGLEKNCTCNSGFHGDGYQCDPIDPCQENNGGCDLDTSVCNFVEPGKSECMCKDGYKDHVLDKGCSLIDICALNASACHPKAVCVTVAPYQVRCTCNEGYQGDGHVCFGNILQTIKDLDESDPDLKGQLTLIQGAIEKYYMSELTQHAPFTIFVPTNEGFRTVNAVDVRTHPELNKTGFPFRGYQKWLNNKVRVRQILRQHVVVGQFTTEKLLNQTVFHTLQGTAAELLVTWKSDVFKFRIFGSNRKAKLERGNIMTSNGIIHIINKLMINSPDNHGDEEKTVYENIKVDGKYNRFQTLVENVGGDVKNILMSKNVTVFVPNNGAFDSLPIGALDFLMSSQGKGHLIALLKNHIFENFIEITDLIDRRRITSLARISTYVSVTITGQFQLNGGTNITQVDIAASNGFIQDIDGVLMSDDISILPNNCELYSYTEVMGPCGDCREEGRCFPPDVGLNTAVECQYFLKNTEGKYVKKTGCALMCNRTITTPKCCDGFYGFDCLPCPGGHKNPCNGRGKCDDGYYRDGTCHCDSPFAGDACDTCADDKHFGPNCTQECTCIHGNCNSGLEGDGKCKQPCFMPMIGENCDMQASLCNDQLHHCHAHAVCIWIEKKLDFRCICLPGYTGNGLTCKEIDPCDQPERGGCHLQATCVKTAPGSANCTCNEGWTGDGKHCHVETTCNKHTDCHRYATCVPTTPGKHICQCKDDFDGNGTYCLYKNRCEVNNGGCDPLARCSHDDRSEIYVNCTCPVEQGYSGNGFSCYGNLMMEIERQPNLKYVSDFIKSSSPAYQQALLDNNYTIFAISDEGMRNFSVGGRRVLHWLKPENLLTLINYHSVLGSYTLGQLVALSEIVKIETMADGYSIYVTRGEDGVVRILPQRSGVFAKVIKSDIIATNGYLNIIDKVLEPYMPIPPEDYPDLETFFRNHSEYSIFAGWLQERNLTYKLENEMDEYTLFVPNNEAVKTINRTVTTDYLRYYVVPKLKMLASSDDNDVFITDLGRDHQLVINSKDWYQYTVNDVEVIKADMFTFGGIVNEIGGLLHPARLQECDEKNITVGFGPCTVCQGQGTHYPCYGRTTPVPSEDPIQCTYVAKDIFGRAVIKKGCQGVCLTETQITGCCAGYYGKDCQECPSGPEFPCNRHGTCSDGILGDGTCQCDRNFKGDTCDLCVDGWTGVNCDIDMESCSYRNGHCSEQADCSRDPSGKITCKCWDGFQGDGYNCTGPCDVANGGCHSNATCQYINKYDLRCSCKEDLVGDGRTYCMGDLLSFLHYLPHTNWFLKSLQKLSNKTLLGNLKSSFSVDRFTVFVPVDKSIKAKMPEKCVLQQIAISNDASQPTNLSPVDFSNITLTTLSNQTVVVTFNKTDQSFYVNETRILSGNIEFTNGIVHIVESPFTMMTVVKSESDGSFPVGALLGPLAALIVLAIAVVGIVMYHRSQNGYWNVLQDWIAKRKDSDVTSQEASLVDDEDDAPSVSGLPQRDNSFGNPMYKSEDL